MRTIILLLLASCTYPVTNVVNEIIETDAQAPDSAAAPGVDATPSPDVAVDAGGPPIVDSAAPDTSTPPVDAGSKVYARCHSATETGICPGDPYQSGDLYFPIITWTGGMCNINGGKSGAACMKGTICYMTQGNGNADIMGICQ